ncbi:hypothetical protein LEP1GSC037_3438 [Leptospira interrogans str. 2006001854]|uniref:Uncharacterized protein n=1 Tax=Leptospira interrogans str. 2006001854 TaxID=1001590 RepID=M6GJY9_LEPIR|nr:hypothetical protein LEP1GSC037_3438 [Leptospira interrogans str. 2006001854]
MRGFVYYGRRLFILRFRLINCDIEVLFLGKVFLIQESNVSQNFNPLSR